MITTEQIKQLRDMTGVSIAQCKKALEDSKGDMNQAILELRKKSADIAGKKGDRELMAGVVASYIHSNKTVGVLIELACETDFVARNEEFVVLARDIAMHIAASSPLYIAQKDISAQARVEAAEFIRKESGAEANEGKIQEYLFERTLLSQPFVKNPEITVEQLINNGIQKFGEKIVVARFARFAVGA